MIEGPYRPKVNQPYTDGIAKWHHDRQSRALFLLETALGKLKLPEWRMWVQVWPQNEAGATLFSASYWLPGQGIVYIQMITQRMFRKDRSEFYLKKRKYVEDNDILYLEVYPMSSEELMVNIELFNMCVSKQRRKYVTHIPTQAEDRRKRALTTKHPHPRAHRKENSY